MKSLPTGRWAHLVDRASRVPASLDQILAGLKNYARAHYNEGGWDYLVESYSDEEILKVLNAMAAPTLDLAIKHFAKELGTLDDYRKDIQATAF